MASRLARWWYLGRGGADHPLINVVKIQGIISQPGGQSRSPRTVNLEKLESTLERAFKSLRPAAVCVTVNSPGGAPGQSEAIFKRIRELSQETGVPIYTFAEDVAASGGYWILSSGDKVFSQYATSLVGSIGVISSSFGVKQLTSSWGIERRVFTAGKAKMGMDPFSDVTEDQEERLRSVLEDMHDSFIRSVKEARGDALDVSCADELFSGRVFTGTQAVGVGLCDGIGTVSSVMKEMFGPNVRLRNINKPWSPGLFSAFQSPPGLGSILSSGDNADQVLTWPLPRTFLY